MDTKLMARIGAIIFVAIAITMTAIQLREAPKTGAEPELVMIDEPSAGLDPVVSAELDELILQLRDAMRMSIVVVTHELESAFKIADTITVLDQGHVLMTGPVATAFQGTLEL